MQIDRLGRNQILLIILCLTFNMVDGFDITAMAVAANNLSEELQLGPESIGLVFSFALAGMMLGAMFLAPVSDLIGRRNTIILALLVIGSTVLMTGLSDDLTVLITLRFISGLGGGALLASQAALASEFVPEKYRAMAVTVVTVGYPMGAMFTGLVAQWVIPEFGWRGLFIGGGGLTLVMAMLAYFLVPESLDFLLRKQPPGALQKINKTLTRLGMEPLEELPVMADATASESVTGNVKQLLSPAYKRQTLWLWLVFFLCFSSVYFMMSWTPKMFSLSGFGEDVGFFAFTVLNFGGVLGTFSLAFLSSRFNLNMILGVYLALSGVGMLVFSLLPINETLMLATIFLIGFMQQGGFTGLYAAPAKTYPAEIRSTGVGWCIGLGRSGAVIGPAVAGFLIAAGLSVSANFMVFAIPMVLGGAVAYSLKVR